MTILHGTCGEGITFIIIILVVSTAIIFIITLNYITILNEQAKQQDSSISSSRVVTSIWLQLYTRPNIYCDIQSSTHHWKTKSSINFLCVSKLFQTPKVPMRGHVICLASCTDKLQDIVCNI